jgi:hypothetical protein
MPDMKKNGRGNEGKVKSGKGKQKFDPTMRAMPSENVGGNSLPGWVKRNINQIEVTEGRL